MKPLTVGKLIEKLKNVDPSFAVVAASDMEGNSFDFITNVETENISYDKDGDNGGNCGIVGFAELTDKLKRQRYTEEDLINGKRCVVLWP